MITNMQSRGEMNAVKPDALRKKEEQIAGTLAKIGFEVQRALRQGKRMVIVVKRKAQCANGGA